jgi:hypothetical protein
MENIPRGRIMGEFHCRLGSVRFSRDEQNRDCDADKNKENACDHEESIPDRLYIFVFYFENSHDWLLSAPRELFGLVLGREGLFFLSPVVDSLADGNNPESYQNDKENPYPYASVFTTNHVFRHKAPNFLWLVGCV